MLADLGSVLMAYSLGPFGLKGYNNTPTRGLLYLLGLRVVFYHFFDILLYMSCKKSKNRVRAGIGYGLKMAAFQ